MTYLTRNSTTTELLFEHGLKRLRAGQSLVPLLPRSKKPHFHLLPKDEGGKLIITSYHERPSETEFCRWFEEYPELNLGVATGSISGVFALDCDFRHGGQKAWNSILGSQEIVTPTTITADGFHVYFDIQPLIEYVMERMESFDPAKMPPLKLRDVGIPAIQLKLANSYLVCPYSIHPDSLQIYRERYGFGDVPLAAPPQALLEQLIIVPLQGSAGTVKQTRPSNLDFGKRYSIAKRYEELRESDPNLIGPGGRYASNSEFDMAIIQSLANGGVPFEEVVEQFDECCVPTKYGKLKAEKGEKAARDYLLHSYNNALQKPDTPEAKAVTEKANLLLQWTEAEVWKGRSSTTDKAVFIAHLKRMQSAKKYSWFLSCREIAEMSEISATTASKSNKRLMERGFLIQLQESEADKASEWILGHKFDNFTLNHVSFPRVRPRPRERPQVELPESGQANWTGIPAIYAGLR